MKKLSDISFLCLGLLLATCTDNQTLDDSLSKPYSDARELSGIRADILGNNGMGTRAGTVTKLADYVGRSDFVEDDQITFTMIRRTTAPFEAFTYSGIAFDAGAEGSWTRSTSDGGPERIYWTDAENPHTFIAYSIPQSYGEYWKQYQFETTEDGKTVTKTYYIGAIGNPTSTTGDDAIVNYWIDPYAKETVDVLDEHGEKTGEEEVYKYRKKVNNDSVFTNPLLEHEDVVIAYDENMQAEPGGSVALVQFHHALSSIRVVVNISGFSSSSTAVDNRAVVSDMVLKHQPTMYIWMQSDWRAQPLRASRDGTTLTDQQIVNKAYNGDTETAGPTYNQRKDIKLWTPNPQGVGSNQSKTFTFYGITTPQPKDYMTTLKDGGDTVNTKTQLEFKVTYPDPLNPNNNKVTKTYTATLNDVYYEAGYNTTINISLNHRNEEMTVGAEYENWQFVATPDKGNLRKNSTFLQDTKRTNVSIAADDTATVDDATWLYYEDKDNNVIKDIYGHTGDSEADAYQISTAYQLVSFAYEVQNGRNFSGKFVRLDADLTLQPSSDKVKQEIVPNDDNAQTYNNAHWALKWIGIGDAYHAFNGTFLGGHRYIYRLRGMPLFANLGASAKINQLNVSAIEINNGDSTAVTGGGLFAETCAGRISGCRVVGNVSLDGTYAGAFVGENTSTGALYASYHIGTTEGSTTSTTHLGGLVGNNNGGIISSCYQAGIVSGGSTINRGIAGNNTGEGIYNTYFNSSLFDYNSPSANVIPKTTAEMTKQAFVDALNDGITTWRDNHSGYDPYTYVYQPANYPGLSE